MSNPDNVQMTLAQSVKQMGENLLAHIEYAELQARITRAKYNALRLQGFTEPQALELCK
jgi:hypothetical protein